MIKTLRTAALASLTFACSSPGEDSVGMDQRADASRDGGLGVDARVDSQADGGADSIVGGRGILHTHLQLNLASRSGVARLDVDARKSDGALVTEMELEIGDLQILSIQVDGRSQSLQTTEDAFDRRQMRVRFASAPRAQRQIEIRYTFQEHNNSDGYSSSLGTSFTWPTLCGNLFPCESNPSDGMTFSAQIEGAPSGESLVYPTQIPSDAPAYMMSFVHGDFTTIDLGRTQAGTHLRAFHLPGEAAKMQAGTEHLLSVFEWLEQTIGPYSFGSEVGTVSARWGAGAVGGMEHHPYFHVSSGSIDSDETQAHEAAHGWYGDGIRIACWEDFVLSEGTTTYLAARALEQVAGANIADEVWRDYECQLASSCRFRNTVAFPIDLANRTCNQIDLLNHPLWSGVPYYKGAFFYRRVAELMSAEWLDTKLSTFYMAHRNQAASMEEMIAHLKVGLTRAKVRQVEELAQSWLRNLECPTEVQEMCN